MDEYRTKQQDLGWRAGRKSRRDRLSAADGGDLILTQSDVLPKECLQIRIRLRKAGHRGRGSQDKQYDHRHKFSDHANFTLPILLHPVWRVQLLWADPQDDLAARVPRLTEFVGLPGIRKRKDGFDNGFQFSAIDELGDLS